MCSAQSWGFLLLWVSGKGSHLVTERIGWMLPMHSNSSGLIQEVHRWPLFVNTIYLSICAFDYAVHLWVIAFDKLHMSNVEWLFAQTSCHATLP